MEKLEETSSPKSRSGSSEPELEEPQSNEDTAEVMSLGDRFDGALLGFGWRFHDGPVLAYDLDKVLEIFMEDGMDEDEAQEWVDRKVLVWVGEGTPMFVRLQSLEEVKATQQL